MATKHKFILLMLFFTITVPGFLVFSAWQMGLFKTPEPSLHNYAAQNFIGLPHRGEYQKAGEKISHLYRLFLEKKLACVTAAILHDDPEKVVKNMLRSSGGCISTEIPKDLQAPYERITIPAGEYLQVTMNAHPSVALRKGYGHLIKASREKNLKVVFPIIQSNDEHGVFTFRILVQK